MATLVCPVDFNTITNEDFLKRVDLLTKTRANTKDWYRCLITQLVKIKLPLGKSILGVPADIDKLIVKLWTEKEGEAPSMDKRIKLINAIITVGFVERVTRACYEQYYDGLRAFVNRLKGDYGEIRRQKAEADGDTIGFNLLQVQKIVLDANPELHFERMVVGLYSLMPPPRLDFHGALIHTKEPAHAVLQKGNHVVVGRKPRVILNEYKTSQKYGQIVNVIPENLKTIILISLKRNPRTTVFGSRDNETDVLHSCSLKLLGKRMGSTIFRHIYASSADITNMTTHEYELFARSMCHGPMTSLTKYRTQPLSSANAKGTIAAAAAGSK